MSLAAGDLFAPFNFLDCKQTKDGDAQEYSLHHRQLGDHSGGTYRSGIQDSGLNSYERAPLRRSPASHGGPLNAHTSAQHASLPTVRTN